MIKTHFETKIVIFKNGWVDGCSDRSGHGCGGGCDYSSVVVMVVEMMMKPRLMPSSILEHFTLGSTHNIPQFHFFKTMSKEKSQKKCIGLQLQL